MYISGERNHPAYSRYKRMARQVSLMRWVIPPALAAFVFTMEFAEHTLLHSTPLDRDFYIELLIFGVLGPFLIAIILTWIVRNLRELELATQAINALNTDLEQKVLLRTEELARANDELRELDRIKSEFVSLVSHELRAPLTNIHGGLELVLSTKTINPPIKSNLEIIQSEVNRLIRLVQRILDVSVIEAGQLSLKIGPIVLRPLLRQVIEHMALTNTNHPIVLDLPPQVHLAIADEERLTDIVTNLLQNAVKYSPDGGEIRVSLRFDDDFAYVSVKDVGLGISPDDISHLTEKFYRGHLRNHSSGYGLGLYFVHELVKAQGGRLAIESDGIPGKGSKFTFTVPLEKESLYERDPAY